MEDSKSRPAAASAASSPVTPRKIRALRRRQQSPLPPKPEGEDESTPSTSTIPTTPVRFLHGHVPVPSELFGGDALLSSGEKQGETGGGKEGLDTSKSFIFSPHSRTGSNGANTEKRNGTQTQQTWMGNTSTDHAPSQSNMFENSGIFVTPETGGRNSKVPMQQATTVNTDTPPKLDIFNFSVPSQTENDRLNSPRGGLKQGIGSGIGNNAAVFGKMDDGISVPGKTQERQTRTSLFEPREKYPTDDDDDGSQRKIKEIWKGSMKPLAEPLPKEKNEDGLSSPPSMSQGSFGPPLGPQGGGFGKEKNGDGSSPQQMDLRAQLKGIQAQMAVLMAELGKAQLDAGNKEHHSPTKEETEATDTSLDDDYSLLPPPQRGQDSSDSPPFRPKTDGPPPPSLSLATITTRIDSESDDAKEQDATELDSKITEGNTELSAVTISSPSSKAVDVIWDWAIPHSRLKAPQSFFSIANMLCRHLTKQDQENSGWIYVLKVLDPQGAGRVKVGKSKALTDRIKQHEKCYGECVQLYPPKGMDPEKFKVPHTARVEALIHTELLGWAVALKQCPRQRSRNHGSHREWFELGEDHVITVVNKWIAWMNSGPYEEVRNPLFGFPTNARTPYKEKHWQLKSFSNETLSKLCTPFDSTLPNSWKRIGYVGSKNSE